MSYHFVVIMPRMLIILSVLVVIAGIVVTGIAIQVGGKLDPASPSNYRGVRQLIYQLKQSSYTTYRINRLNRFRRFQAGLCEDSREAGVVLLLHGIRSDRRQMLTRQVPLSGGLFRSAH